MMLKIEDVTSVVVGQTYLVPSIVVTPLRDGMSLSAPIMGNYHHDAEIGNPLYHFHYDERFLTDEIVRRVCDTEDIDKPVDKLLDKTVLVTFFSDGKGHRVTEQDFDRQDFDRQWRKWIAESVKHREFLCVREFPVRDNFIVGDTRRYADLEDQLKSSTATEVCPHKGTSLKAVKLDAKGCRTCPAHGLRWGSDGKLVRRTR